MPFKLEKIEGKIMNPRQSPGEESIGRRLEIRPTVDCWLKI